MKWNNLGVLHLPTFRYIKYLIFGILFLFYAFVGVGAGNNDSCAGREGICIKNDTGVGGIVPLLGGNITYDNGGNGLISPDGLITPEIEARRMGVKRIGLDWMRFPGGSAAHTYDFSKAIGPFDERENQFIPFILRQERESSVWGPDEAAQLAQEFEGNLLITIPFGEGANKAAKFVDYMNGNARDKINPIQNTDKDWAKLRSQNGHKEPYKIKYWEIGNESGGPELIWSNWPDNGDDAEALWTKPSKEWLTRFSEYFKYGGIRNFRNQKMVKPKLWGLDAIQTTAAPHQKFYTKFGKINNPQDISISIGNVDDLHRSQRQKWEQVKNFNNSGPHDRHYVLINQFHGTIQFGDGINGAIPEVNKYVYISYESGHHDGFIDIYKAMKRVDPSIHITATYHSMIEARAEDDFPEFEGYQRHGGKFYEYVDSLYEDPYDICVARGGVGLPALIENQQKTFDKSLGENNLNIIVSEYSAIGGLQTSDNVAGIDYYHSLCGALTHGLFAIAATEQGNVPILGSNRLISVKEKHGTLVDQDGILTGPGKVFQLMSDVFAKEAVTTVDVGEVTTRMMESWISKNRTTLGEVKTLEHMASYDPDTNKYYLFVINTTDKEQTTRINSESELTLKRSMSLKAKGLNETNKLNQGGNIYIEKDTYNRKPAISFKETLAPYEIKAYIFWK